MKEFTRLALSLRRPCTLGYLHEIFIAPQGISGIKYKALLVNTSGNDIARHHIRGSLTSFASSVAVASPVLSSGPTYSEVPGVCLRCGLYDCLFLVPEGTLRVPSDFTESQPKLQILSIYPVVPWNYFCSFAEPRASGEVFQAFTRGYFALGRN